LLGSKINFKKIKKIIIRGKTILLAVRRQSVKKLLFLTDCILVALNDDGDD